jgi:hypothetical protein
VYNGLVENGNMLAKTFHDTVLKEGNMPVEMVRYLLRDEKPPRDFETTWRFYEDFDYADYGN